MEFHDAANIFPLDAENIDALAADIKKNGQHVPIETMDGKILDGRRRWLACEKAKLKPVLREVSPDDPVAYVLSLNLHRRHLEVGQRAMVGSKADELYETYKQQARDRMREAGSRGGKISGAVRRGDAKGVETFTHPSIVGKSRDHIGALVGVSGPSIDQAKKIRAKGEPEIIAAVESGSMKLNVAADIVDLPREEQKEFVEADDPRKLMRQKVEKATPDPDNNPEDRKSRGKGVQIAHEAINLLQRIPKNDLLAKRGLQIVQEWVQRKLKEMR